MSAATGTPLPPSSSSRGVVAVVDDAKVSVVPVVVDAVVVPGDVVVVPPPAVVAGTAVVGVALVVATDVGGGTNTVDVVVGASGFVVDGVVCGVVPPATVDNIGAGLSVPAAPIHETTSPVLYVWVVSNGNEPTVDPVRTAN